MRQKLPNGVRFGTGDAATGLTLQQSGFVKGGTFRQTATVLTPIWVRWLRSGLALVAMGGAAACATERPPKPDLSENRLEPTRGPSPDDDDRVCLSQGCACEDEGATQDCGTVKEQVAGYLWCSIGEQVCDDGVWSECRSERVVLSKQMLNLRLQGLGASRPCGDDNPCSPGCHLFEDDAGGLPLGPDAGLVDADGGLALAESPNVPGGLCTGISLTSGTPELEITDLDPFVPLEAVWEASLIPEGCGGDGAEILLSVDRPDVAQISETGVVTLVAPVAGPIEVRAHAGRLSAAAILNVLVRIDEVVDAPADLAADFDDEGEAEDTLLRWLYPYAGTVFPPNVQSPLLQWDSLVSAETVWNGGCALRSDGSRKCWGANFNGEIVDDAGPFVQLSGRYMHFCALTPEGNADCWGDNSYGQGEDQVGPFVSVQAGAQHSCGLGPDGGVRCWGRDNYGQATPPSGSQFVVLGAGAYNTCGVRVSGDVECWGNGSSGQAGIVPGQFVALAAGTDHVCALGRDHRVSCWGSNVQGQTNAPAGAYVALDAGISHSCGLRTDGAAVCWGQNSRGQAVVMPGPFVSVTAAGEHSCGVLTTGGVQCWGESSDSHTAGLPGGAVRVGVRYPATGDALFRWTAIVPESQSAYVDAPKNTVPLAPAPRFRIPESVWQALAASARGEEFAFTIQRHTGERLLRPAARVVRFSDSPLTGKIVYQSYGTRRVENATGTYEDPEARWGAVLLGYDAQTRANTLVAGYDSEEDEWGTSAGCRGCHSVGVSSHALIAGFHDQGVGMYHSPTDPDDQRIIAPMDQEWEGTVWSAVHPTLPLAFTSRGPTPCATRVDEHSGSCIEGLFTSAAGDLSGEGYVLQSPPGAMLGAGWLDADGDGVYESAARNQLIDLRDDDLGQIVPGSMPEELRAAMPTFSPEGDRVAFVHYAGNVEDGVGTIHSGDRRSLGMMDFDSSGLRMQNFQRLTNESDTACDVRFDGSLACADVWPSFLPAGAGVVFQRQIFVNGSISGTSYSDFGGTRSGCASKDQPTCDDGAKGELWWVALDSDGQPNAAQRLTQASGVVDRNHLITQGPSGVTGVIHSDEVEPLLNYQPSVSPRTFGRHNWVAFTSRRAYGNVAQQNPWWSDPRVHPLQHAVTTKKLWLSALDVNAASGDPSAPAFYLEGQEVQGANGRPVWVADECVAPSTQLSRSNECETDADCCGAPETARCEVELPLTSPARRHCVPAPAGACVERESPRLCRSDEECCGVANGERCASGACVTPPPLARYQPATFVRDFHADCPHGTLPHWKFLEWQAQLPAGTSVEFAAASAPTEAELEEAGVVELATAFPPSTTTWNTWGTDESLSIESKLAAEGYPSHEWLRVSMTLLPDENLLQTPKLTNWRLVYDCADGL